MPASRIVKLTNTIWAVRIAVNMPTPDTFYTALAVSCA